MDAAQRRCPGFSSLMPSFLKNATCGAPSHVVFFMFEALSTGKCQTRWRMRQRIGLKQRFVSQSSRKLAFRSKSLESIVCAGCNAFAMHVLLRAVRYLEILCANCEDAPFARCIRGIRALHCKSSLSKAPCGRKGGNAMARESRPEPACWRRKPASVDLQLLKTDAHCGGDADREAAPSRLRRRKRHKGRAAVVPVISNAVSRRKSLVEEKE